ncbi:MAG: cytochrome c1 [Rhodospirillaceae bacterium]
MKTVLLAAALAFGVAGAALANEGVELPSQDWPQAGPFGRLDMKAARRGFQVYKEVCSGCHSISLASYRNLRGIGFTEDQVKAIAAEVQVSDGPNDQGEMFQRPGRASDRFVKPFPNDQAARAANGGALPPDLSVVVKARHGGEDYITGLLVGYEETPPAGVTLADGKYYNKYFPGHQIGMPKMLNDDGIDYADKTDGAGKTVKPTALQQAMDVSVFLSYIAEPSQDQRKNLGIRVMIFLAIFTGLMFACKKKVWRDVH